MIVSSLMNDLFLFCKSCWIKASAKCNQLVRIIFHKYDLYFIRVILIAMSLFTLFQLCEGVIHNKRPVSQFTEVKKCSLWCDSNEIQQSNKGKAATDWYKSQRASCLHYVQTASSTPQLYLAQTLSQGIIQCGTQFRAIEDDIPCQNE